MKNIIAGILIASATLAHATPTGQKVVLPEYSIQVFKKISSIDEGREAYLDIDTSRISLIRNECTYSNCSIQKNTAELEFGFSPAPVCYFPEGFEIDLKDRSTVVKDFNCK